MYNLNRPKAFEINTVTLKNDGTKTITHTVENQRVDYKITPFDAIRIYTAANRRSIRGIKQYEDYFKTFNQIYLMETLSGRKFRGIGEFCKAVGSLRKQISFHTMGIIIDVNLYILNNRDGIPSLLTLKEVIDNKLDLKILNRLLKHEGNK